MTLLYWQRHMLLQILYLLCFTSLSRAFASSSSPRRNRSSISYAITYDDNHPNPNCYNKSPTLIYASSNRQGGDSGNRRDGDAITDRNDSEGASNTTSVVMTPLLSALAGKQIKSSVWGGCGLALCGLLFLISTTTSTGDVIEGSTIDSALSTINVSQGDVLILLGALSWSTLSFVRQNLQTITKK